MTDRPCLDRCIVSSKPGVDFLIHLHPTPNDPEEIERVYLERAEDGELRGWPEALWLNEQILQATSFDEAVALIERLSSNAR